MKMRFTICLLFFISNLGLFAQNSAIITANELENNFNDYVIIDVSKPEKFAEKSILGAKNIGRPEITNNSAEYGGLVASKEVMEELLTTLGIEADNHIVLYDHKGGSDAARVWWILSHYGHSTVQLLDGGLHTWGDRLVETDTTRLASEIVPYKFPNAENANIKFATLDDVKKALDDPNTLLVDTRNIEEYEGIIQKDGAFKKGRIPGSIHLDWASNIDYHGDQHLLSTEELLQLYESKGITKDKNIIVYCHSGVRCSHTAIVLTQLLGYKNVMNYDGSWIEWSYNTDLPIETGPVVEQNEVYVASYGEVFWNGFKSFGTYTWNEITCAVTPWYVNYFWWLVILSLVVWGLEIAFPWRKNQPIIRKDFWLDAFFMFFNFYIFKLIIFMSFSEVTAMAFHDLTGSTITSFALFDMSELPLGVQLVIFFIATDFIQWFTHVLLHRYEILWRFHKVHHSVEQMGFAAHLRYHWMENVFYTPMKYIMVMLIGGFTPEMAYIVFYIAIAIGHFNHANIGWSYGPLKYIINNPKMHIWHHAKELPRERRYGVNFGISLSIWDYLFGKNYIPSDGRDIELGFDGMEKYPKGFFGLIFSGFRNKQH